MQPRHDSDLGIGAVVRTSVQWKLGSDDETGQVRTTRCAFALPVALSSAYGERQGEGQELARKSNGEASRAGTKDIQNNNRYDSAVRLGLMV